MEKARKPRTNISLEMVRIVRGQMSNGRSNKEIAEINLISLSCATNIANKISRGLSDEDIVRKKGRKPASNSEIKSQVSAIVQLDNALTQKGIAKVLEDSGIRRSQPFISKLLRNMEFTRKRLSLIPAERNSTRILDMRSIYCTEIRNISVERLVFLDETGFNLHTSQNYGYSLKNTKAYSVAKANRGTNQSLMCAIDVNGVVCFEIISGAYNGETFKKFIQMKLVAYFTAHRNSILIMDNCRFHHRQDVLRLFNENMIAYKFIPPYSPQLNPIEEFFSSLKAHYKMIRPRPLTLIGIRAAVASLLQERNRSLHPLFERMRNFAFLGISRHPFL